MDKTHRQNRIKILLKKEKKSDREIKRNSFLASDEIPREKKVNTVDTTFSYQLLFAIR